MIDQYYQDNTTTIYAGGCIESMRQMEVGSVNCCVTSPPYWGLRDYGTATWEGGDEECDHREERGSTRGGPHSTITGVQDTSPHIAQYRSVCPKCGAVRIDSQLGIEKTPEEYVAKMVEVFREVRRVLRDDGTLWLNLGDSYCSTAPGTTVNAAEMTGKHVNKDRYQRPDTPCGLKPKDLVGIPWRVAFALQADGWWLRQDIIWHKPNPMPESVTDRCTKAHEYIFLLSKSARYFYDAEAIREPHSRQWDNDKKPVGATDGHGSWGQSGSGAAILNPAGRNKRSVWTVPTAPFRGSHFAVFPPALILPCILAGCPEGGTVLDCFGGSGTTAAVARNLGRKAVLCELNEQYIGLIKDRLSQEVLPL